MATVNAPYPSRMDAIHNASISFMTRTSSEVTLYDRAGNVVATYTVQHSQSDLVEAIVSVGAFDAPYREILVSEWYQPGSPNTKLSDSAILPAGQAYDCSWSSESKFLAVAHATTPFITVYERSGDTLTKLANPPSLPDNVATHVAWSPGAEYLVVNQIESGIPMVIYKRTGAEGETLTKISGSNFEQPAGQGGAVSWSPDATYLAITHQTASPYLTIYKRSGDLFTKLTDIDALTDANSCAFSPDGNYLAVTATDAPRLMIYKRSGDTFNRLPDLIPDLLAAGYAVAWSPNAEYLAVSCNVAPWIVLYKRSGDSFTKLADVVSGLGDDPQDLEWSPDGRYLLAALNLSPYYAVYKRNLDVLTKLPDCLEITPPAAGRAVSWTPDGLYLSVATTGTPYVQTYKSRKGSVAGPAMRTQLVP